MEFEFNELKFKEFIETKRKELENNPDLIQKIESYKLGEVKLRNDRHQLVLY